MDDYTQLKVGDEVCLSTGHYGKSVVEIKRITPKQIIVKWKNALGWEYERRFWIKNGFEVGRIDDLNMIRILTPEIRERTEIDKLNAKVKELIASIKIPKDKQGLLALIETIAGLHGKQE